MPRLGVFLILLALLFPISSSRLDGQAAGSPESVIRRLFLAIYRNDVAVYNTLTTDEPQRALLTTGRSANAEALQRLKDDPESLQVREMRPVLFQGKPFEPAEKAPVGSTALYMAAHQGGPIAIPLVHHSDGWKVDVRWWIAAAAMQRDDAKPSGPEIAIKSLLASMLRLDRNRAARYITRATDIETLFTGAPRQREPSGVLDAAVGEMPLIEIRAGEFQPMPSGRVIEGGSTDDRKVLVGLYGPIEMAFVVHRAGNEWRVEAEPYFFLMMQ